MKGKVLELPTLDKIEHEAGEWDEKLDRGLDASEYRAFKQWIGRSKRHHDSVVAMAELWDQIDIDAIIEESEVVALSGLRDEDEDDSDQRIFASLLAALVLIVGIFSAGMYFFQDLGQFIAGPSWMGGENGKGLQTQLGEVRSYKLTDSSQLFLNTRSQANVNYSSDLRSIVLNEGELFIRVAPENNRPMLVIANGRMLRATDSAFNVRRLDDRRIELTVIEGSVSVNKRTDVESLAVSEQGRQVLHQPITDTFTVDSGERIILGADAERVYRLAPQNVYALSFWRESKLLFTGESLAYVVAEMGRYSDKKIVLHGEETKNIRINGLFEVNNIDGFLYAIEKELDLRTQITEDTINIGGKGR